MGLILKRNLCIEVNGRFRINLNSQPVVQILELYKSSQQYINPSQFSHDVVQQDVAAAWAVGADHGTDARVRRQGRLQKTMNFDIIRQ